MDRAVSAFDAGFSGMVGRAQNLYIIKYISELGMGADRQDVIDLEPTARAALDTLEPVPP